MSSLSEHNISMGQPSTSLSILASKPRCIKQDHQEAIKIGFHPTIWTGKVVSPWAGHGSLQFKPWRNARRIFWGTNFDFDFIYQCFYSVSSKAQKWVLCYSLLHFLLFFGKELLLCFLSCLVRGLSSSSCPFQDLWFALTPSASSSLFMASWPFSAQPPTFWTWLAFTLMIEAPLKCWHLPMRLYGIIT